MYAKLVYSLSGLRRVNSSDADAWINTEYVDCQGQGMSDSNRIGKLCMSGMGTWMALIESVTYELQENNVIMGNPSPKTLRK